MSLLLITHDLNLVRRIAHRVCVMQQGRIVEQASCQELFAAPRHPYTRELLNAEPSGAPASNPPGETLLAVDDLRVWFPIRKGVFRRTVDHVKAVDGVNFELPAGRRWASLAKAARASRPLAWQSCGCWKARAASASKAPGWTVSRNMTCARCAARCRWCSRTRMAASAHACVGEIVGEGLRIHRIGSEAEQEQAIIDALVEVGLDPQTRYRYPTNSPAASASASPSPGHWC